MNKILALSGCKHYPDQLKGQNQYLNWQWLEKGILKLEPLKRESSSSFIKQVKQQVLISTGIHGNETAPIEIVSQIVCQLLNGELALAVKLLVVFGNIKAIQQGARFIDADLNRMFNSRHLNYPETAESKRAVEIERYVQQFFVRQNQHSQNFHFDLHTAIRGSAHEKFGLLPQRLTIQNSSYLSWLISMGLQALVVNSKASGTFSSFTSIQCQAISCTLELGKAKPFGKNDLHSFSKIQKALLNLIQNREVTGAIVDQPAIYVVEQELIKLSDNFQFIAVNDDVVNFTRYDKGTLIATDGEVNYQVNNESEWILFPNPWVQNGFRAGILLAKGDIDNLFIDKSCQS